MKDRRYFLIIFRFLYKSYKFWIVVVLSYCKPILIDHS